MSIIIIIIITLLDILPVAYALHEMSLRSSDVVKNYLIDIVPLVFLAMHIVVNNEGINNSNNVLCSSKVSFSYMYLCMFLCYYVLCTCSYVFGHVLLRNLS